MNKRLRRKKRVGEFAEFGFYVEILVEPFAKCSNFITDEEDKAFFDWWDAIHDHFTVAGYCLTFGGNLSTGRLGCIAEMEHHGKRAPKRQMTEADRLKIIEMVKAYPGVKNAVFGKLNDLWKWTKVDDRYFDAFHEEADRILGKMHG